MKKSENIICLIISVIPTLILWIVYGKMVDYPSTHIFNSIQCPMEKQSFAVLMVFSVLVSYVAGVRGGIFFEKVNAKQKLFRYVITVFFSVCFIILILTNLK